MINILYLLKTIESTKLSDLINVIDAPPLDIDLAIWGAVDNGDIEIDVKKDRVTTLKEAEPWNDQELSWKLMAMVKHYVREGTNPTRGRMDGEIKIMKPDGTFENGYPWHEYLMTRQHLVDTGMIVEDVMSIPGVKKKRPFHRFVFMGLPENDNEEMNAKAVNKWLAGWDTKKVK